MIISFLIGWTEFRKMGAPGLMGSIGLQVMITPFLIGWTELCNLNSAIGFCYMITPLLTGWTEFCKIVVLRVSDGVADIVDVIFVNM
jgi:hypothetical protein